MRMILKTIAQRIAKGASYRRVDDRMVHCPKCSWWQSTRAVRGAAPRLERNLRIHLESEHPETLVRLEPRTHTTGMIR